MISGWKTPSSVSIGIFGFGHLHIKPLDANPFPLTHYLVIFRANIEKDLEKFAQYSNNPESNKLSDFVLQNLEQFSFGSVQTIKKESKEELVNCILTWKDIFVFPVFDLFVLFANSESFSAIIEKNLTRILYRIEQLAESSSGATKTMALRFLANFSGSRKGCEMLTRETVLYGLVGIFRQCEDRSVTLALCTLMLNLCVFAYNERCEIKFMALVPVLVGILSRSTENIDEESCFRALVAVGTICWQSDELLESFKQRNIVSLVDSAKNIKSPKVENCCSHLKFLLEKDF